MSVSNIFLIIILVLLAGFFSSSETAYLSLSELKVRNMVEQRKKGAKVVEKLKSNMDRLLTTVLIGTNLVNSFTSAFITAFAISIFGPKSVEVVPFIVAFFLTTFGQIIPKTAAGIMPENVSLIWAIPLKVLEIVFFPVIVIFELLARGVVKTAEKIIKPENSEITEEELKTLIDVGEHEGTIEKDESYMMNKLIKFSDLKISDIMKPCSEVSMIPVTATKDELIKEYLKSGYSTLTVYCGERDNVVGVINYKSILYSDEKMPVENDGREFGEYFLGQMMDSVITFNSDATALTVLNKFRKSEHKFAIVKDAYNKTVGIVTIEDIMRVVFVRMTDE